MSSKIWADQAEFNLLLRALPTTFEGRTALTKEFVLHLISECDELLRASGSWRSHRKDHVLENPVQVMAELTDIRKYWISLCQVWGFTEETMDEAYWRKSAAVRQRHVEEWIRDFRVPSVIVDLDNVLCDYIAGFVAWIRATKWVDVVTPMILTEVLRNRVYLTAASLGISPILFNEMKHQFRTSGAKRHLPLCPGAKNFTRWCGDMGWQVIILTSRPIDLYPTLYEDTIAWLDTCHITYAGVWWGTDKASKIIDRDLLQYVQFVVDDDPIFVDQYARQGIKVYWVTWGKVEVQGNTFHAVPSLETIVARETQERTIQ